MAKEGRGDHSDVASEIGPVEKVKRIDAEFGVARSVLAAAIEEPGSDQEFSEAEIYARQARASAGIASDPVGAIVDDRISIVVTTGSDVVWRAGRERNDCAKTDPAAQVSHRDGVEPVTLVII